jgi:hypothetical protein
LYTFPSTLPFSPKELALEATREFLDKHEEVLKVRDINKEDIMRALKTCLDNTVFVFDNKHYRQLKGTAMGCCSSMIVAEVVMDRIDHQAAADPRVKHWLRYVVDVFCICKEGDVEGILAHINSLNLNVQFTVEKENDGELAFLDLLIHRREQGFSTTIYRKPTHSAVYLNASSHNPESQKKGTYDALMNRAVIGCSSPSAFRQEKKQIREDLKGNGYSDRTLDGWERRWNLKREKGRVEGKVYKGRAVIPYVVGLDSKLKRILKAEGVQVFNMSAPSLGILTTNTIMKGPTTSKEDLTDIVYSFDCKSCPIRYYGETMRTLKTRKSEHQQGLKGTRNMSNLGLHAVENGHQPDWDSGKVHHAGIRHKKARTFLEAWNSTRHPGGFSNKVDDLPLEYEAVLHKIKPRARLAQAKHRLAAITTGLAIN